MDFLITEVFRVFGIIGIAWNYIFFILIITSFGKRYNYIYWILLIVGNFCFLSLCLGSLIGIHIVDF